MKNYLLEQQETKRLYFRKVLPSDFDAWLPFFYDPDSTKYWEGLPDTPEKACREQFERIFERYTEDLGGMNALIDKKTEKLIGLCGLLLQTVDAIQELEIGYSLLPNYRGKGFAIEAAKACKDYAFDQQLAPSLISIIQIHNLPSQKVALKNGMHNSKTTNYKNNPVYIYRVMAPVL